ncbi:AHH domain-containing protein [Listeria booriae]|uniref:Uncharacterized protein n=1 Tax=Listeria booriae TaxID=1552123 RepID=A0A7X1CDG1_9LIST|nr:T7SS effector LXG polymorphic toxin [Listeria booriae]MBC1493487.1 hypothetical protein [Listeria booriae]MBC1505154.1 hypothetical protein [Listeria booriae]MBC1514094.1 hypothetical protein [Listeria booriae]MBC6153149.1 hypothetical protein [Listeria booriae]MBC6307510.1 hypothetical protein [Listeria booriae]
MPRIEIGEVRYFVGQFLRESERLRDALGDYRKAVAKLLADDEIKGEFADSAKSYYEKVHYPIVDTTIECLSEADRILKKYVQDFESQVDDSFDSQLDSDKLDALYAEIRRSENLLDDFTHAMDSMTGNLNLGQQIGMKLGLETSMMQIKEEIKILERYLDFEHSHTNVMHDVLSRMHQVKTGMNEILAGKAFNGTTHTYDSSKMQLGWLNHLVPEKKPKKTYNFDDYTKTLEDSYWILSKNGITNRETAEASIAYNDGLKDGTIKVTSEETGDFMTDYMLDAMKGINTMNPDVPLTKMQSFSIIAGVLVGGIAIKGRGIKIPKYQFENIRIIPGKVGVVVGGNSTKLGKNMLESMGLSRSGKWTGYQAQHVIPADMAKNPVIKKIGMNLDDATNGLFLRVPDNASSPMSRHRGYHSVYNEFVQSRLLMMDTSKSVFELQKDVFDLQNKLIKVQKSGLPLYPSQGATVDLWERHFNKIK